MDSMFLEVSKAEYDGDYRLRLWFNNGEVRIVDFADKLKGEVFLPLQDKEYFQHFSIPLNTVEWPNGADFAPEFLYEHSIRPYDLADASSLPSAAEEMAKYGK